MRLCKSSGHAARVISMVMVTALALTSGLRAGSDAVAARDRIAAAVERADAWLVACQTKNGNWLHSEYQGLGLTALAAHALEGSPGQASKKARLAGLAFLRARILADESTEDRRFGLQTDVRSVYDVAETVMALTHAGGSSDVPLLAAVRVLDEPTDKELLVTLCRRLEASMLTEAASGTGGWTYLLAGPLFPDLRAMGMLGNSSCTEYAVQAIAACVDCGIDVDSRMLAKAAMALCSYQGPDGGFFYGGNERDFRQAGGPTCAAVGGLELLRLRMGQDAPSGYDQSLVVACRDAGRAWMTRKYRADASPTDKGSGKHYYSYLLSLARAYALLSEVMIGKRNWREEVAKCLLDSQSKDGSWGPRSVRDTSLAVLVLRERSLAKADSPAQPVTPGK